jgi:ferredoxin, 2Fe-2S
MAKITVHLRNHDGASRSISAPTGQSLMRAATRAGVEEIAADCGGCLTCATCHVYVDSPWLASLQPAGPDELAMLEMTAAERRANSRLSCQLELSNEHDGLTVELPRRQY